MIVIRDNSTRKVLSTIGDPYYRGLKADTDARLGYATLTVNISQDAVPQDVSTLWRGQELQWIDLEGIQWEGAVQQIQAASGYWSLQAIGHGPSGLTSVPPVGMYYEDRFQPWQRAKDALFASWEAGGFILGYTDTELTIGLKGGYTFQPAKQFGFALKSPGTLYTPGTFTDGNIKWWQYTFDIIGTDANFSFRTYVRSPGTTTYFQKDSIALTPVTGQTSTYTSPTGWDELLFWIVMTSASPYTFTGTDNSVRVRISRTEESILQARPTVDAVIQDVLRRQGYGYKYVVNPRAVVNIDVPMVYGTSTPGQQVMDDAADVLRRKYGTEWVYGVWDNKRYIVTDSSPLRRWRVNEFDAGQDAVYNSGRDSAGVGGNLSGVYSHVRGVFTDPNGYIGRTQAYSTGISLPVARTMEIPCQNDNLAGCQGEASGYAVYLGTRVQQGNFLVNDLVRREGGGYRSVTAVRAGDWLSVDGISPSRKVTRDDIRRGGIVGHTTYDGDRNNTTIQLIGNQRTAQYVNNSRR